VPVFATGYRSEHPSAAARAALASLQNLAVTSGGFFAEATPDEVGRVHEKVQAAARQVHVVRMRCGNCGDAPLARRLSVSYTTAGVTVSDSVAVTLIPIPRPCGFWCTWKWWIVGASTSVVIVGFVAGIIIARRRRAARDLPDVPQGQEGMPHKIATLPWRRHASVPRTDTEPPETKGRTQPAPAAQALVLTTVHGGKNGQRYTATVTPSHPIVGGRASDCSIVLQNDPAIADRQFEVRYEGASLIVLIDLVGGGKTQKNGVPIVTRARLEDGDIIGAGSTELRVRFGTS
jgi:hypothetical protein